MQQLHSLVLAMAGSALMGLAAAPAVAAQGLTEQVREARQEGTIWTAFAFNRHLGPFSLNVDVEHGLATLTGTVANDISRELAEQVALGVDGIEAVDNLIRVDPGVRPRLMSIAAADSRLDDATVTAKVKSKLLWNTTTEGLDIGVETREGLVTLSGRSASAEARELAGKLATSTEGVERVDNAIQVISEAGTAQGARDQLADAGDLLGDAWITGKVKTRFLSSDNLAALDISVETDGGVVRLVGNVATAAEKALAVETARNVRGVLDVHAASLKVAG